MVPLARTALCGLSQVDLFHNFLGPQVFQRTLTPLRTTETERVSLFVDTHGTTDVTQIVSTGDTLGGEPRIDGRRIGVLHIAARVIDKGEHPEDVAADYELDLAAVHHALAYYYDHPDEMQEWREKKHQAAQRASERQLDPEKFRQHA